MMFYMKKFTRIKLIRSLKNAKRHFRLNIHPADDSIQYIYIAFFYWPVISFNLNFTYILVNEVV